MASKDSSSVENSSAGQSSSDKYQRSNCREPSPRPLNPSDVAEVVQFGRSEVFAALKFLTRDDNARDKYPVSGEKLAEPDYAPAPALVMLGKVYEEKTIDRLVDDAEIVRVGIDSEDEPEDVPNLAGRSDIEFADDLDVDDLMDAVKRVARGDVDGPVMLARIDLAGRIEAWPVEGEADLLVVWPLADDENADVHLRVIDIKAGEEKPHHQIQATMYAMVADDIIARTNIEHTVSTGIIDGDNEPNALNRDELPSFDAESRRADVERLLAEDDGLLARVFEQDELPAHELNKVARESQFGEYLVIKAIEERDIRLLGLSLTEQQEYRGHGLDTLEDVAELIEAPEPPYEDGDRLPKPYHDLPEITPGHEDTVHDLNGDHRVGERVQLTAQRAQAMLGRLNPDHPHAHPAIKTGEHKMKVWLQGSGRANLPEDDPPYPAVFNIPRGSLIRVYFDVQTDPLNERVLMLSAALYCNQLDDTDEEDRRKSVRAISKVVGHIPPSGEEYEAVERELLSDFSGRLFTEVMNMGAEIEGESSIHFFFHTYGEHCSFYDALRRHADHVDGCRLLRNMFDLRGAVNDEAIDPEKTTPELTLRTILEDDHTTNEQRMVSRVRPALRNHLACTEPGGHGIPRSHDRMKYHDKDFWTYKRGDGSKVNLRDAFAYEFLARDSSWQRADDGTLEFIDGDANGDADGYCLTRPRDSSNLQLAYFWGAIHEPYEGWKDTEEGFGGLSNRFLWVNSSKKEHRIRREDIKALGERLAIALCDIENELAPCRTAINKDPVEKHPLPTELLEIDELFGNRDEQSLADGCRDVIDLEYDASKREHENRLERPVLERIRSGRAMPVKVVNTPDDDGASDAILAKLAYDHSVFDGEDREFLKQANRIDSLVTATQLTSETGELAVDEDRWGANYAPRLRIDHLDADTDLVKLEEEGTKHYRAKKEVSDPYIESYPDLKIGQPGHGKYEAGVMEGDLLLLDEGRMTFSSSRARHAINGVDGNPLYELLENIRTDDHTPADLRTSMFNANAVEAFLDDLDMADEASDDEDFLSPNTKQADFIRTIEARLGLLQGPPGTGKTKGALANGLLSRASARVAAGDPLAALVVGPTHNAIDEVLEETADQRDRCVKHDVGAVEAAQFVRLHSSRTPADDNTRDDVLHLSAKSDAGLLRSRLRSDTTIVFATPQTVHRLVVELTDDDSQVASHSNSPELFDLLAVDEASMMRLPQLFMLSSLITHDAQVIIAGDHRQMPPVQQHPWADEERLSTTRTAAFVSVLNYFRFLRGDEVDRLERHEQVTAESPEADCIEMTRLVETYRCHRDLTELLRRWVYQQDDIPYTSDRDEVLITSNEDTPNGLEPVVEESPLVLITHDDRCSHQRNETEAHLVSNIADLIPDRETVGVVAPHNAQKALVNALTEEDVDADTVERFQGAQRDVVIVSATASDPSYLDEVADFLLNPNRLTVALSRMKKKLVVLAPESLFEMIPPHKDGYEDAQIWKNLHNTATEGPPAARGRDLATGVTYFVHRYDG